MRRWRMRWSSVRTTSQGACEPSSSSVRRRGAWSATYVARATTPGVFVRPPAYAEEMYNPAVYGRSDGGVFTVKARNR